MGRLAGSTKWWLRCRKVCRRATLAWWPRHPWLCTASSHGSSCAGSIPFVGSGRVGGDSSGDVSTRQCMDDAQWRVHTHALLDGILLSHLPAAYTSITAGNGARIPVTSRGSSILTTDTPCFILNNVLVAPSIIRNLLCVQKFTRNNGYSIEFDAPSFFVKEPKTRRVILRSNGDGELYTIPSIAY